MIDRAWESGLDRRVDRAHAQSLGFDPDCGGCNTERFAPKWFRRHRPECLRGQEQDRQLEQRIAEHGREQARRSAAAKKGWEKRRSNAQ